MLHFKIEMKILSGDPCFKTPRFNCLTQHSKQGSSDILLAASAFASNSNKNDFSEDPDNSTTIVNTVPTSSNINDPVVGLVPNVDLTPSSTIQTTTMNQSDFNTIHSDNKAMNLISVGSVNTAGSVRHDDENALPNLSTDHVRNSQNFQDLTSSATSNNTTYSSSNFDTFEPIHSRSNSSQTSSSRVSATGFNSLPTHSRQNSADSDNNNARFGLIIQYFMHHHTNKLLFHSRYSNEIKFNSVDRVGNKRNNLYERMKPTVNGVVGGPESFRSGPSKKAIDSTRVSADQFVQELLQKNIDETIMDEQRMNPFPNDDGGLDILVQADGSATIVGYSVAKSNTSTNQHHNRKSSGNHTRSHHKNHSKANRLSTEIKKMNASSEKT
ncbi:hypothetical protein SSS_08021 [Sarcoptes scabiei]|uniref:Uncharacterized protein n=1 Tax=Sarcoptes scabiei TaxID=52283 RepID=A0A834VG82_SARSC|nr:hypothetical protein SSS_08021 [Sarcoptes scabiei]